MELRRTSTPYNNPPGMVAYQNWCNRGVCKADYPPLNCVAPEVDHFECRPFGYQPKRRNPGSLKFYMYDYPFHTSEGVPLKGYGRGWNRYETTGKYYEW